MHLLLKQHLKLPNDVPRLKTFSKSLQRSNNHGIQLPLSAIQITGIDSVYMCGGTNEDGRKLKNRFTHRDSSLCNLQLFQP